MPPNLQSRPRAFPTFLRAAFWIKLHVAFAPMLLVAFSFSNAAQSVKLAWDASPSPGVSGYKIYYGTSSGSPGPPRDVGNVTSETISNLNDSTKYFFSVTAYYDPSGPESARSNEVSYTTPAQQQILYPLTVNFGTASPSGPYPYGAQVSVSASPQPGEQFERWDGDWDILASRLSADTTASIVRMEDLTITAIYKYTVTVTNGSGDGNYFADETVQIVADAAPAGQQFAGWTLTGKLTLADADAASPTTTFKMPASAVAVTANYSALPKFTVTVTNGTGDGNYFAGETVQIVADAAPAGQQFAGWTLTGNATLANAASPTTTFKMPASAVTVTANYKVSDKIRYYPRSGHRSRMVGGVFEGTNDPASGYKELHKISATPSAAWTTINVNLEGYKYLRYRGPNGSYGNVAEIEFYRNGAKIKGTGYGTTGSYRNRGATFSKALDANISTYFDGPTANGNYVGIITPN